MVNRQRMDNYPMTAPNPERLALNGLRVLEIGSGYALAYTGKLFADFGAEVIKLDHSIKTGIIIPDGDEAFMILRRVARTSC